MKEMTIEQKAKAYDEALEKAKQLLRTSVAYDRFTIEKIFPELRESEDERIRKMLIKFFGKGAECNSSTNGISDKDIVAWLEKQGEQPQGKTALEAIKEEKVDNQNCVKPFDKVEPKFKVGDWITNGEYTWKVTDIKTLDYILQSQDGHIVDDTISYVDEYFRLWTIQDAKNGDTLVDIYNNIGIFQKCKGIYWLSYLYLGCNGELLGFSDGGYHKQINTYPATKEQCDALEKAMADAGYTSGFGKKELKKIIEEVNDEDYEIDSLFHAQRILEKTLGKVEGYQSDDGILDHKAAITTIKKLYAQKHAWGEEDEQIILSIEQVMNCASLLNIVPEKIDKIRSWLKSLKDRVM